MTECATECKSYIGLQRVYTLVYIVSRYWYSSSIILVVKSRLSVQRNKTNTCQHYDKGVCMGCLLLLQCSMLLLYIIREIVFK